MTSPLQSNNLLLLVSLNIFDTQEPQIAKPITPANNKENIPHLQNIPSHSLFNKTSTSPLHIINQKFILNKSPLFQKVNYLSFLNNHYHLPLLDSYKEFVTKQM